jgi:predicted N-acetyltransferase YhbS
MKTIYRQYDHGIDYEKVCEFLLRTYSTTTNHVNWLQPRWEYMHYHPLIRSIDLGVIGIWEANGEIVGVVHPEHFMGTAYFEIHAKIGALWREMLTHAEERIAMTKDGKTSLSVFIHDRDDEFQALAAGAGYAKTGTSEPMSHLVITHPFPAVDLPDGFRLMSLASGNDLAEINRLLFRGFNHGDEPPDNGGEDNAFIQSAPNYRKDLNIVVQAPDGDFVSYCGMWYEPQNQVAYVEPVCTDPVCRRMGLASAAVLEGIRRCGELGATVAYVGTDKPLYLSIGFQQIYNHSEWRREWT